MAFSSHQQSASDIHPLYERRFRSQQYFLADQLRHGQAVQEVQSIRNLLTQSAAFGLGRMFQFVLVPVEATDTP